jgi:hypothetical protein
LLPPRQAGAHVRHGPAWLGVTMTQDINQIANVRRFENFSKDDMTAFAMDLTHGVYPHEEIYGSYCTLEEYIDCPPESVYEYLSDVHCLAEWTYSMREFAATDRKDLYVSYDRIGGKTRIFTQVKSVPGAMTVDYHCAWDQGEELWMIYLMRVVPAELVLKKPGSVVLWTNCTVDQLQAPLLRQESLPREGPGRP